MTEDDACESHSWWACTLVCNAHKREPPFTALDLKSAALTLTNQGGHVLVTPCQAKKLGVRLPQPQDSTIGGVEEGCRPLSDVQATPFSQEYIYERRALACCEDRTFRKACRRADDAASERALPVKAHTGHDLTDALIQRCMCCRGRWLQHRAAWAQERGSRRESPPWAGASRRPIYLNALLHSRHLADGCINPNFALFTIGELEVTAYVLMERVGRTVVAIDGVHDYSMSDARADPSALLLHAAAKWWDEGVVWLNDGPVPTIGLLKYKSQYHGRLLSVLSASFTWKVTARARWAAMLTRHLARRKCHRGAGAIRAAAGRVYFGNQLPHKISTKRKLPPPSPVPSLLPPPSPPPSPTSSPSRSPSRSPSPSPSLPPATQRVIPRPISVACLHGYSMSGSTMAAQMRKVTTALNGVVRFTFLTAPHVVGATPIPNVVPSPPEQPTAWWLPERTADGKVVTPLPSMVPAALHHCRLDAWPPCHSVASPAPHPCHAPKLQAMFDGVESSLEALQAADIAERHVYGRGFDGLLGFSQGAALAHLACTRNAAHSPHGMDGALRLLPDLKHVAFVAGYPFGGFPDEGGAIQLDAELAKAGCESLDASRQLTMRSMHISGTRDPLVSPATTAQLTACFDASARDSASHPGGHSPSAAAKALIAWYRSTVVGTGGRSATTTGPVKGPGAPAPSASVPPAELTTNAAGAWVYRCNVGVEAEAAGRSPTKSFMTLRADLAALPWVLATSSDIVIAPTQREAFLSSLRAAGVIDLPTFSPTVPSGQVLAGERPFGVAGEHLRRSRVTRYRSDVTVCTSLEGARAAMGALGPRAAVVKADLSSSGLGVRMCKRASEGEAPLGLGSADERWVSSCLRRDGAVTVEPALDILAEFSGEWLNGEWLGVSRYEAPQMRWAATRLDAADAPPSEGSSLDRELHEFVFGTRAVEQARERSLASMRLKSMRTLMHERHSLMHEQHALMHIRASH